MNIEKIRNLQPNETLWDTAHGCVKGLHARNRGASIGFYLYYRTKAGQQRKPKIGAFGEITLAEARKRARNLLARVAIGEDPKADWEEAKGEPTVKDLFEITKAEHWSSPDVCTRRWAKECELHWKNHLETKFSRLKLSDVTPGVIRSWHKALGADTPRVANVALRVLSTMFNHAIMTERRPQGTNPCMLVKPFPEKKRKRFASEEEMKAIAVLLEKYKEKHAAPVAFLYTLMFSGSRPSALERARPEELEAIEVEGTVVGVLTSKGKTSNETGEDDVVVFPPQAMRLIESLPANRKGTIFGIKNPKKLWKKIREEAGCEDLWARDFRRAFASYGIQGGVPIGAIGELLNHRSTQTTKIYAKLTNASRIEAASKIAAGIENMIKNAQKEDSTTPPNEKSESPSVVIALGPALH